MSDELIARLTRANKELIGAAEHHAALEAAIAALGGVEVFDFRRAHDVAISVGATFEPGYGGDRVEPPCQSEYVFSEKKLEAFSMAIIRLYALPAPPSKEG